MLFYCFYPLISSVRITRNANKNINHIFHSNILKKFKINFIIDCLPEYISMWFTSFSFTFEIFRKFRHFYKTKRLTTKMCQSQSEYLFSFGFFQFVSVCLYLKLNWVMAFDIYCIVRNYANDVAADCKIRESTHATTARFKCVTYFDVFFFFENT